MLFYWDNKFQNESVGEKKVYIQCKQCQFVYFYLLTRIGYGSDIAPYWIGNESAKQNAQKKSRQNLGERLDEEAEPVPCPQCGWINIDLIEGYRKTRYRFFDSIAIFIVLVGSAIFLITSWFLSIGPAVDRWLVPYCLIGGPLVSFGVGMLLILLRDWLRGLIQPYRDFQRTGKLPIGTPPALIWNPTTNKFQLADQTCARIQPVEDWVEFWIGRDSLPKVCCGCLGPSTKGCEIPCKLTQALALQIPFCSDCKKKSDLQMIKIGFISLALGYLAQATVMSVFPVQLQDPWLIWMLVAVTIPFISLTIASNWVKQVSARRVDTDRAITRLRFRNRDYQQAVILSQKSQIEQISEEGLVNSQIEQNGKNN